MNFDNIKDKLVGSRDKVGEGLDKAGGFVKTKFGHDKEVDKGVQAGKDYLDREAAATEHPVTPVAPITPVTPVTPTADPGDPTPS